MQNFTYLPDSYFDLGEAGEHPCEVTAWIQPPYDPRFQASVNIVRVIVKVSYPGDEAPQILDITKRIKKYPMTRERWEDEVRKAWESAKNRHFDDDPKDVA